MSARETEAPEMTAHPDEPAAADTPRDEPVADVDVGRQDSPDTPPTVDTTPLGPAADTAHADADAEDPLQPVRSEMGADGAQDPLQPVPNDVDARHGDGARVADHAISEQPDVDEPVARQVFDEPDGGQATVGDPDPEQQYAGPVSEQEPAFEQPAFEQPAFEQPAFEQAYVEQPYAEQPAAGPVGQPAPVRGDSRNMAVVAHLSAFVAFVGIPSLIGPLVVWLIYRDRDEFVSDHAKEALNFNLSLLIYGVAAVVAVVVTLGIAVLAVVPAVIIAAIGWLIVTVIAAVRAADGRPYRYPLTIRLVS